MAAGLVVLGLTSVPYWLPLLSATQLQYYGDWLVTLPLAIFATITLAVRARRSTARSGMRFWRAWAMAFGLWVLGMLGQNFVPSNLWEHLEVSLSLDAVFTAFYLCIAFSVELPPLRPDESVARRLKMFEIAGGLVVLFGALFYFILIPLRLHPASYDYYAPTLQMYVLLDLYLAFRLILLANQANDTLRSVAYRLLASVMAWCALTDFYEFLTWNEFLAPAQGGTAFDFLWLPPHVLAILAARWGVDEVPAAVEQAVERRQPALRTGLPIVYACTLPFVHVLLYRLGWLDPVTEQPRLLTATIFMLLLAGLAATGQRLLDTERSRLEAVHLVEEENRGVTRKMEALGRMAGGVAHDFNNFLTVIGGAEDIVTHNLPVDSPEHEWLQEIRDAALRARVLTQQLLAFSRQEPIRPMALSIDEFIDQATRPIRMVLGHSIQLEIERPSEAIFVSADSTQLQRVLLNLAANSRDAMPTGGRLEIVVSLITLETTEAQRLDVEPGDFVVLTVTDTGTGIDEASLSRVFEPFFTTKPAGTGLGLASCFGIVRQLHGTVAASNTPAGGARFTIFLPALSQPLDSTAQPTPATSPTSSSAGTILLADDELAIRRLMSHMLADAGHTILEASSGREALAVAERFESKIDLLLTDVLMPGMTGPELVGELLKRRPETRVAYCSGNPRGRLLTRDGPLQRVPLLRKPFDRATLTKFVDDALAQPAPTPAAPGLTDKT